MGNSFDFYFDKVTESLFDKYCGASCLPSFSEYKREIDMFEVLNDNNEQVTLSSYLEAATKEYRINVELNYNVLVKYMIEHEYLGKEFVLKCFCEYCIYRNVPEKCFVKLSSVIDELPPVDAILLGVDLCEMELNYLDAYYNAYNKTVVSYDEIKFDSLVVDSVINYVEKYGYEVGY